MKADYLSALVLVDVEGTGASPVTGRMTEFGAVHYLTRKTFHGHSFAKPQELEATMRKFAEWLTETVPRPPIFVSDNPAYDWQWINCAFHATLGRNPFGHSARRIGDFYAGLMHDFTSATAWKKYRKTRHDHNPAHDALGNAEALEALLQMAREQDGH